MSQKLRVLFMQSQTFFGADSMIHSLLMRYYNRERIEVHVACVPNSKNRYSPSFNALKNIPDIKLRLTIFGPSIHKTSKKSVFFGALGIVPAIYSLIGLAWYIKKHNIDIIHCTEKPRDAFYGMFLAKLTGAKCVIHLHVKCENWLSPLVKWAMHKCHGIIGVSEFVAESIKNSGYDASKTYYVLNSLDISDGKWEGNEENTIRQEFGIEPETPLLAIISRIFHWKGHTQLIEALAQVKTKNSNFKLLIVGEDDPRGDPQRPNYSAELKGLALKLGLTDKIIFAGYRSDIPKIMSSCDLFTMPSFEEPFGVVFLEAMALKKPVIALNNGGTCEVVENGKSGLLSQPYDLEELASNILTLINDPDLRTRMGTYGRERVEKFFNPTRMATDTENIYRLILDTNDKNSK